jgi:glutathione synthase/RimK-type ligase-like ATP-grasp enzyme
LAADECGLWLDARDPEAGQHHLKGHARVALATCAEVARGDEDAPALVAALAERSVAAESAVWDDATVAWTDFDLVVVRSTWDYAERRDDFLTWAASLPRVLNPVPVLRWNTDKRYLLELGRAGVPVVPTRFLEPGEAFEAPSGRYVVKPAVSAGSRHSARYEAGESAEAHVSRLHSMGRTVMVQPYLNGIDDEGETMLIYLAGSYSHAVRKAALLRPGQLPGTGLYLEEDIRAIEPTAVQREVGDRALRALESDGLSQARVDLVPDEEGPVVLEVELTEPSLYLGYAAGATERFAAGIAALLEYCRGERPPT